MKLEEAIEEVKRWSSEYYGTGCPFRGQVSEPAKHLILNAVASGQLAPKADEPRPFDPNDWTGTTDWDGTMTFPDVVAGPETILTVPPGMAVEVVSKADADLAVAEALRKAGEAVPQGWCEPDTSSTEMDVTLGSAIQRVIKRLANQDHLAEVQALRAVVLEISAHLHQTARDRDLSEGELAFMRRVDAALTPKGDTP